MNITAYKQLLEAFYEGITSLEDEKALKAFFDAEDVPADMLGDKRSFLACYNTEELDLPEGMLERLERTIDTVSAKTDDIMTHKQSTSLMRSSWMWTTAAAASLLLLFTIGLSKLNNTPIDRHHTDTFTNPAMAAIEADKAVQLMAEKLNRGYQTLYCANIRIDKTEQTVNKQLSKLTK